MLILKSQVLKVKQLHSPTTKNVSTRLESPLLSSMEVSSEVCGRFCIRFIYGNCVKGSDCEFCHLENNEMKADLLLG